MFYYLDGAVAEIGDDADDLGPSAIPDEPPIRRGGSLVTAAPGATHQ